MENNSGAAAQALGARLRDLEQRGGARTTALRAADAPPARQHGLLFRLASHQLLTPVERLLGVWPLPRSLTTVPGTARWVLGVASHAGELLPIYDLRGLLLADYEGIQRRGIALVVPGASQPFGVVVDAVIGLRRTLLRETAVMQAADGLPLADLITGTSDCAQGEVPVIDLAAVERLPAFISGALGVSAVAPLRTPAAGRAPRDLAHRA
ncbi:chemotaxis protein CheW [uncultured Thiohalocapsa sp.]|uniref:chemotaxis protein CheW n=1 Tax=uncultured Thiohalocapsa sp. TaxID=768990 RepID=UPI0025E76851|nr:chemotaxis protein CheW [uncultured Thiohalocapsa sp.]